MRLSIPATVLAMAVGPLVASTGNPDLAALISAASSHDAQKAAERLIRAGGIEFDAAAATLRRGRTYDRRPAGRHVERLAVAGSVFENVVDIPADYDPARRWPLRVQLHGGIGRDQPPPGTPPRPNRIPSEHEIEVLPQGWGDAAWWHPNQVENILALVDRVKRTCNVDESHIYLTGISDGGTGVFYLAMREASPWSAFLPLNGSIRVLANARVGADGDLFVNNLVNRPFFIVNGGQDPLYPAALVEPTLDLMTRAGVPLVYRPQPEAGHDTSWWPDEQANFVRFVNDHPRAAHPERLSWQTERTDRYNRLDWLIIDALGAASSDVSFPDVNSYTPRSIDRRGNTTDGPAEPLFGHRKPSGRVDVVRKGQVIEARTRGVRAFTLLLSPDAFDFGAPVTVIVNGRTAFDGPIAKSVATLLKWAARDDDRTRLYGAELTIRVP